MNDTPPTSEEMQKHLEALASTASLLRNIRFVPNKPMEVSVDMIIAIPEIDQYIRTLERDKKVLYEALKFINNGTSPKEDPVMSDKDRREFAFMISSKALSSVTPPL